MDGFLGWMDTGLPDHTEGLIQGSLMEAGTGADQSELTFMVIETVNVGRLCFRFQIVPCGVNRYRLYCCKQTEKLLEKGASELQRQLTGCFDLDTCAAIVREHVERRAASLGTSKVAEIVRVINELSCWKHVSRIDPDDKTVSLLFGNTEASIRWTEQDTFVCDGDSIEYDSFQAAYNAARSAVDKSMQWLNVKSRLTSEFVSVVNSDDSVTVLLEGGGCSEISCVDGRMFIDGNCISLQDDLTMAIFAVHQRLPVLRTDDVGECVICMTVADDSHKLAELCCKTCRRRYHFGCLLEWLLARGKSQFGVLRGPCVQCEGEIELKT